MIANERRNLFDEEPVEIDLAASENKFEKKTET